MTPPARTSFGPSHPRHRMNLLHFHFGRRIGHCLSRRPNLQTLQCGLALQHQARRQTKLEPNGYQRKGVQAVKMLFSRLTYRSALVSAYIKGRQGLTQELGSYRERQTILAPLCCDTLRSSVTFFSIFLLQEHRERVETVCSVVLEKQHWRMFHDVAVANGRGSTIPQTWLRAS